MKTMKTEVKIHITEDDLSDSIKSKIKALKKQGIAVEIIWPDNYDSDKYNKWPYITPSPAPINPIPPYPQDPVWTNQTPSVPIQYEPYNPWRAPDNLTSTVPQIAH